MDLNKQDLQQNGLLNVNDINKLLKRYKKKKVKRINEKGIKWISNINRQIYPVSATDRQW